MSSRDLTRLDPAQIVDYILPFLLPKLPTIVVRSSVVAGGSLAEHELAGGNHTGTLADAQAPQFLKGDGSRPLTGNLAVTNGVTIDGVDLSAHAANPDAHHARPHNMLASGDHTVIGSAYQIVGLTGTNTLGLLSPSSDVRTGAAEALLKSNAAGEVGLKGLAIGSAMIFSGANNPATAPDVLFEGTGFLAAAQDLIISLDSDNNASDRALIVGHDSAVTGGFLELFRFDEAGAAIISGKVRTPLIDTASGQLTLQPAGDVVLDPGGNDVLPGANYQVNLGAINRKYLSLWAAELWVETLVAQETIATIGGRVMVGPTTSLTRDFTPADTQIYVKHNQMVSGDRVYMEAAGKVEFMAVTSAYTTISTNPPEYRYNVTRNLDGSGANQWYAGDAAFNTGQVGNGFIDLYSLSGIPRAGQSGQRAGPTIVGNVRLSTTYNAFRERWAVGNLNALYDYGNNEYGAAFGNPLTAWVGMDEVNGFRVMAGANKRAQLDINGNFSLYNSSGSAVITLDSAGASYFAGVMTIGVGGEIRQGTGTPGTNYTGLRIWRDGSIGRIGGYNNNVVQWYADTDGRMKAAGGDLLFDNDGITAQIGTALDNKKAFRFVSGGVLVAGVRAAKSGANTQVELGGYFPSLMQSMRIDILAAGAGTGNAGEANLIAQHVEASAYAKVQAFADTSGERVSFVLGPAGGTEKLRVGTTEITPYVPFSQLVIANGYLYSSTGAVSFHNPSNGALVKAGTGGLYASNDSGHASRTPANGIYSLGAVAIGVTALASGVMLDVGGQTYMRNALTLDGAIYLDALAAAPAAVAGYLPVWFDNATQTLRARLPGGQIKVITWANA